MKLLPGSIVFIFLAVGSLGLAAGVCSAQGTAGSSGGGSAPSVKFSSGGGKSGSVTVKLGGGGGTSGPAVKPGGGGGGKPGSSVRPGGGGGKPGSAVKPGGGKPGKPQGYKPSVTPSDHQRLSYGATPTDSLRYGVVPDPWKEDKKRPDKRRHRRDRDDVIYYYDNYYNGSDYYIEPEEKHVTIEIVQPEPPTYFTPGPFEPFDDPRFPNDPRKFPSPLPTGDPRSNWAVEGGLGSR